MGIAALAVIGVGLLLVITGLFVSVSDWRRKQKAAAGSSVVTEPKGLAEQLSALQKLAEALGDKELGFQLIILGMAMILIGGVIGSVAAI